MSFIQWFMVWYEPKEGEHIAYMTTERMATIGGSTLNGNNGHEVQCANQGIAIMTRWCRLNCQQVPMPVNVRGKTGFAFTNLADALMFKLVWA